MGADTVAAERGQLINLTYRLLGSLADAEDAVQETYARWYAMTPARRAAIASPGAWLTTVASRVCLDVLGSARVRRERYVGEWIPEPLPEPTERAGGRTDPADRVTLDESVTMAFLVVLESLTPAERVAFVLHDVFAYRFAEIGEITGRTPAACRQLASSARRRVRATQAGAVRATQAGVVRATQAGAVRATQAGAVRATQAGVVRAFKRAWEAGDVDALVGLLDPAVTLTADGGGRAAAALHPIHGGERVARAHLEIARAAPAMTFHERTVNGRPGLVAELAGRVVTVYAFDVTGDRIRHIWAVRNPEKLRPWTASS